MMVSGELKPDLPIQSPACYLCATAAGAKDLNFSRICSRLVDVRDDMIDFYTVKSQAENDFSDICYKLFSLFFCIISYLFCTRSNYPNSWFTRSFLARSAHKRNKIDKKKSKYFISITHIFRSATYKTVSPKKIGVA